MELAGWNRNCLLLPRAIYRENPFMKRIFAPLALAATLSACGISQQQEIQMGQENSQQINAPLPIISDPEVNRYVNLLGDQIASHTSRADLDWHFYVVDSKEVNAFAVPGGYVYVNRGLIERTSSMDELAGVLGHEIGHVVLRHSIKQMEQQQGANVGLTLACVLTNVCSSQVVGAAVQVGGTALFARFSRQDEAEADQQGVINTIRAGISPQGMVTMFEKLLQERKTQPSAVEGWFATHPLEEDRIAAVRSEIAAYPPSQLKGLQVNSSNYTSFVARVRSLPPSRQ
jgi:predicted Zn-dependent protease